MKKKKCVLMPGYKSEKGGKRKKGGNLVYLDMSVRGFRVFCHNISAVKWQFCDVKI